jgi:ElaB/YqjD/DUF883 family membrane-anchored ribosome-binding protein
MTTPRPTGDDAANTDITEPSTTVGGAPDPITAAGGTPPPPSDDPDAIRADIERTREQLGDSVEALAAKTDVKAQARQRLAATKDRARHAAQDAGGRAKVTAQQAGQTVRQRPAPILGVLAAIAAAIGAVVLGRRRRAAKARAAGRRRSR